MIRSVTLLFLLIGSLCNAGDPKYPVSAIPAALTKEVNAVVREDKMSFKIISQHSAILHTYFAISIFSDLAKQKASMYVSYDKLSKVTSFTGSVYDAKGELIKKLKKDDVKDHSGYDGLYSDNRVKWADLSQTSYPYTVVFEYEKEYRFLYFIDGSSIVSDEKIAVEYASYQLIYPANLEPRYHVQNINTQPSKGRTEDGFQFTLWEFKNILPLQFEPFSFSYNTIPMIMAAPSKFEFEGYIGTMNTWDEFGRWIGILNKGRNILPEETKQKIKELTRGLKTNEEKAKAVYEFVQNRTRYVSIQLGIGGFQPFEASVVDKTGYGDCKALSNYTLSLLEVAGIKGNYALIRAGKDVPEMITDFPSSQFNHAVTFVPNGSDTLWLECTSQTNPFGYAGTFTGDRKALAITENGAKIVKTPRYSATDNVQSRTANVYVQTDGNAKANVKTTYAGLQYENDYLNFVLGNQADDQKKWIQNNTSIPSFDINSFSITNKKDKVPSAKVNLQLTLNRLATVSGKRLFLTPNLMNRSTFIPEKVENRKTPVELKIPYTDFDTIQYHLPEELYPEYIPEPIKFDSRFGEYEARFEHQQGTLMYTRKMRMKQGQFPAGSYAELIDFYRKINKADHIKLIFLNKT